MRAYPLTAAVLLLLATLGDASAQRASGGASSANPGDVVGAAKKILRDDGSQPGDESLSCDEIGAQLEQMYGGMADLQTMLASARTADAEVKKSQVELAQRQATEGPALTAAAAAETRAAVAVSVNPVAGAAQALAAKKQTEALIAEQNAKAAQGGMAGNTALQAFKESAGSLVTNDTGQLTRMNALMQLSQSKGCGPPPGLSKDGYFDDDGEEQSDEEALEKIEAALSGAGGINDGALVAGKKKNKK